MRRLRLPFCLVTLLALCALTSGCLGLKDAREIKAAPMPQKYVKTQQDLQPPTEGSLWNDQASLYEDRKARRVNDLLTILINEKTTATKKATTNAKRDSKADYPVPELFNASLDFKLQELVLLKQLLYKDGNKFIPSAKGSSTSSFAGAGDTARQGTLSATITAKVIEVLPNANMVIESRKEIVVNNEKEIVVVRGIVRPDDISQSNVVLSQNVGDAQIYLVGDGVLDDKQSQGWLVRFLDTVWPF
jgi:flagellar L-ring protein precursor FlgH